MKAVVAEKYGPPDVLELKEVEKPLPEAGQALVKIHAVALNAADWHLLRAEPFLVRLMGEGLLRPKRSILGSDIAGVVEAVGAQVTQVRPGDEVFGEIGGGGLAEYAAAAEKTLAPKPAPLSFDAAAAVPMAALTALQGLRDHGQLKPGQKVLIHGASGGVGTFAVQIAKALGAEVTAVTSPRGLEQARSLGADHVIDYTRDDFSHSGRLYDLILAANGDRSLADYERALAPNGIYVMVGGSNRQMFQSMLLGAWKSRRGKKMGSMLAKVRRADLVYIGELIEAGKVVPVIDRCYPLEQAAEAFRYLYAGHARGKIVITLGGDDGGCRREPAP